MSHAGGGQRQVQKQVQGGAFTKRHLGATLCPRTERHPSALSKILPGKTVICLLLAPFRKHPRVPLTQNGVPGRRSGRGEYCHLSHVLELLSF